MDKHSGPTQQAWKLEISEVIQEYQHSILSKILEKAEDWGWLTSSIIFLVELMIYISRLFGCWTTELPLSVYIVLAMFSFISPIFSGWDGVGL